MYNLEIIEEFPKLKNFHIAYFSSFLILYEKITVI